MTFHFAEACANVLTNPAIDPVCKTPEFKVCAVKVERKTEPLAAQSEATAEEPEPAQSEQPEEPEREAATAT